MTEEPDLPHFPASVPPKDFEYMMKALMACHLHYDHEMSMAAIMGNLKVDAETLKHMLEVV